jgi:Family of unknown function (DUF6069)
MNDSTITDTSAAMTDAAASVAPPWHRRRTRALTLVGVALAGLVVWAVSVPILGIDLTVGASPATLTITPLMVGVAALVPGALAWALLALLERFFGRGRRAWLVVGWAVLALSLTGPVSMGASGATLVSLVTMHLVVGITLIVGLTRPRPHGRRTS